MKPELEALRTEMEHLGAVAKTILRAVEDGGMSPRESRVALALVLCSLCHGDVDEAVGLVREIFEVANEIGGPRN